MKRTEMVDLVVTCPQRLWAEWVEEGDAAGEPETGAEWHFYTHWPPDVLRVGGLAPRLYVVAHGRLRGYAPIVRIERDAIVRRGGAVAVTIPEPVTGFRGWRRRWWNRADEVPFPDWMTEGVPASQHPNLGPGRRLLV